MCACNDDARAICNLQFGHIVPTITTTATGPAINHHHRPYPYIPPHTTVHVHRPPWTVANVCLDGLADSGILHFGIGDRRAPAPHDHHRTTPAHTEITDSKQLGRSLYPASPAGSWAPGQSRTSRHSTAATRSHAPEAHARPRRACHHRRRRSGAARASQVERTCIRDGAGQRTAGGAGAASREEALGEQLAPADGRVEARDDRLEVPGQEDGDGIERHLESWRGNGRGVTPCRVRRAGDKAARPRSLLSPLEGCKSRGDELTPSCVGRGGCRGGTISHLDDGLAPVFRCRAQSLHERLQQEAQDREFYHLDDGQRQSGGPRELQVESG
eukprot:scaffold3092_cov121-Isochrysis_galbana.AAC.8